MSHLVKQIESFFWLESDGCREGTVAPQKATSLTSNIQKVDLDAYSIRSMSMARACLPCDPD